MSECEPCGFCHVLVGFELICFHFMLSMAWSSTCFLEFYFCYTPITHFTLFSTIILSPVACLPTHSPIPHSLTSVQPTCSPHDTSLLILSCTFHSYVHAITPSQPCNIHASTHLSLPISMPILPLATFFFSTPAYPPSPTPPCARVLFSGWKMGSSQAGLPFPTDLAGAVFGVRRRCFGSERLSPGYRRRPARRPLRLLPRRGRRRPQRRCPPAGAVASKAMHPRRLGVAAPAPLLYVVAGGGFT